MARLSTSTTTARSSGFRPVEDIPPQVKQRIAELAYQLYEKRGKQPGHELEDWLEAERRVLGNRK